MVVTAALGQVKLTIALKEPFTAGCLCDAKPMYTLPGVIVPGVHLGCTYKCRGCGYVYNQRFDNWGCRPPAEGVHGAGCLTAKFWRGQMSSQDLEEALTEQEEEGGSLAERVEGTKERRRVRLVS